MLSGEYLRMKETFNSLANGLTLASLLIYFLMVGLDKSFVVPLSVMSIVPLCLIGTTGWSAACSRGRNAYVTLIGPYTLVS